VSRPRLIVSVALVLVAMLLLGSVASAATYRIRAKSTDAGFKWRPKTLEVPTDSRVVWKMVDGRHNVTSMGSNWSKSSGDISQGGSTSFTFDDERLTTVRYSEPAADLIPVKDRKAPFSAGGAADEDKPPAAGV